MIRDTLFLLAPGFDGEGRREYCPECAEIWGLLAYFPAIRESLKIIYQPIERPRADMVRLLGEEVQNCPTLVLGETSPIVSGCGIAVANQHKVIDNARDIACYYAHRFGTPFPRGYRNDHLHR